MPSRRAKSQGNQGIQAENVSAGVLAVGHRARASSHVERGPGSRDELEPYIARLDRALPQVVSDDHQLQLLHEELTALRQLIASPKVPPQEARSVLERFVAKLKMARVAVSEIAELVVPLGAIAKALHVPWKLLGLG